MISRDCSPPSPSRNCWASGVSAVRDSTARSAPSRPLAWPSIAVCRLVVNDPIATSAAMPRTIESENSSNRFREARESRQAILRMKFIRDAR